MPRYFFDLRGAAATSVDHAGVNLNDDAQARAHAMTRLPAPGQSVSPMSAGEYQTWTVTIRKDDGTTVMQLVMAIMANEVANKTRLFQRV